MTRAFRGVSVAEEDGGFGLLLDGKPLRTPGKRAVRVPGRALAEAAATEWREQNGKIDFAAMPLTRLVNTLLDLVAPRRGEVAAETSAYTATDLLCYRAAGPEGLVARQARLWDPPLDRLAEGHGVRLSVTAGLAPAPHDPAAIAALGRIVASFDPPHLLGLNLATTASGSVVLGLALVEGEMDVQAVWEASVLDEAWQAEQWGEDAEAVRRREAIRRDIEDAARWISLLEPR